MKMYQKKSTAFVVAVQLRLDTIGFVYQKWGSEQKCKPNDWLVDNDGEVYTIDKSTFEKTYRQVKTGIYAKKALVMAEIANEDGKIETKEGTTHYKAGWYIVHNSGHDRYAVDPEKFEKMYEHVG